VDQSDTPNMILQSLATDRPCQIRYLWRRTPGVSRARNEGVAAALHNVIVMIDDDVLVAPSWFGAITKALVDFGPDCVVTGQVLPAEADNAGGFAPSTKVSDMPEVYEGRIGQDVLYAANMAI